MRSVARVYCVNGSSELRGKCEARGLDNVDDNRDERVRLGQPQFIRLGTKTNPTLRQKAGEEWGTRGSCAQEGEIAQGIGVLRLGKNNSASLRITHNYRCHPSKKIAECRSDLRWFDVRVEIRLSQTQEET